jgi:hypothetical protein
MSDRKDMIALAAMGVILLSILVTQLLILRRVRDLEQIRNLLCASASATPAWPTAIPTREPEPTVKAPETFEPPTLTPTQIPPTPTVVPACVGKMALVRHLTYDDEGMYAPPEVAPGQPFVKTWRFSNTGTCTWDASYALVYVEGSHPLASMGGSAVSLENNVPPDATYDLSIELIAPSEPGVYQGFWQMRGPQGDLFGEQIWVGITVIPPDTPIPVPTLTPVPVISLRVDRQEILSGECSVFGWDVQNVDVVYFYGQGDVDEKRPVANIGERKVCPSETTEYTLEVIKRDGTIETRTQEVSVTELPDLPVIVEFRISPESQLVEGQCAQLGWEVEGEETLVVVLRNGADLWKGAPLSGSMTDCPPGWGDMTYVLKAENPGGSEESVLSLSVVAPTLTPTLTPTPTHTPTVSSSETIPVTTTLTPSSTPSS